MNRLVRTKFSDEGVFGEFFFDGYEKPFMITLEHAYVDPSGNVFAKIPSGSYRCVRGLHELHSGPVETFEVLGVEGHSGLLCCHVGNFNRDSDGCVLAGKAISGNMITDSKEVYEEYMQMLDGVDEFQLEVI